MKRLRVAKRGDMDAPFFIRWAARLVVWWMNRRGPGSYQVSGQISWVDQIDNGLVDYRVTEHVRKGLSGGMDAQDIEIYHWILRTCGYSISPYVIYGFLGRKYDGNRKPQEGSENKKDAKWLHSLMSRYVIAADPYVKDAGSQSSIIRRR